MVKYCSRCKLDKEFSATGKMCQDCNKEYQRKHYQANKAKYLAKSNQQRDKLAQIVRELKMAGKCLDCGHSYVPVAMDYHHLTNKLDGVSQLVQNGVSVATLLREIEKCVLLCAVCHRIRHAGLE